MRTGHRWRAAVAQPVRHDSQHARACGGENPCCSAVRRQRRGGPRAEAGRFFPDPGQRREYRFFPEPIHLLMKVETHNHPTAIAPYPARPPAPAARFATRARWGGFRPKAGLVGFSVSNLRCRLRAALGDAIYGKPERIARRSDIMLEGPIGGAAFNNEFGRPAICGYFRSFEQKRIAARGARLSQADHDRRWLRQCPGRSTWRQGRMVPAREVGGAGRPGDADRTRWRRRVLDGVGAEPCGPRFCLGAAPQRRDGAPLPGSDRPLLAAWDADNPIRFIHDVGAGGLSNALPELVKDGGRGGRFALRAHSQCRAGLSPLELWCNEAQERYVLAVEPEDLERFDAICARERCPYAVVGEASASGAPGVDRQP
jgi:phosphoribosylformylglycinamidine synthase